MINHKDADDTGFHEYAADIKAVPVSHDMREDFLGVVVRTWTLCELLPDENDRLPQAPSWNGERRPGRASRPRAVTPA
jgi:hypothetical protein